MTQQAAYPTISPAVEAKLRQGFKYFNRFMMLMWRLGLGKQVNCWPEWGGQIMVLTHLGRKSGLPRRTPVNYALIDGEIYCTAGFGPVSDWYKNIKANPQVEVWLPDGWWVGQGEEVTDPAIKLPILRQVLIASGFAARVAGINPHTMPDDVLTAVTQEYRVLHIRRAAAQTGPHGPGDLVWVWPVAAAALVALLWLVGRSKR